MGGVLLTDQHVSQLLLADVDADDLEPVDGGGAGLLSEPGGLVLLADGSLIIADTGNNRLAVWDPIIGWSTSGAAGTGTNEYQRPTAVAVDAQGRVLVVDSGNHRIVRMDAIDGSGWETYGEVGMPTGTDPAVGRFADPRGIAVDGSGRISVTDPRAGRVIRLVDLDGTGWSVVPLPPQPVPPHPMAVCAVGSDHVAISDVRNRIVHFFDLTNIVVATLDGAALGLPLPTWLAADDLDAVFVGDPVANDVRRYRIVDGAFVAVGRLRGGGAEWPTPRFDRIGGIAAGRS